MRISVFQPPERPVRQGMTLWHAWRRRLRAILRRFHGPAANLQIANPEMPLDEDFTIDHIEVHENPLFTLITVNGRPYYIHR